MLETGIQRQLDFDASQATILDSKAFHAASFADLEVRVHGLLAEEMQRRAEDDEALVHRFDDMEKHVERIREEARSESASLAERLAALAREFRTAVSELIARDTIAAQKSYQLEVLEGGAGLDGFKQEFYSMRQAIAELNDCVLSNMQACSSQSQAQECMQSKLELVAQAIDQIVEVYKPNHTNSPTQRGDVSSHDFFVGIERHCVREELGSTFDRLAEFERQVDQRMVNTEDNAVATQMMTNSGKELGLLEQTPVGRTTALHNAAEATEAIRRETGAREEAIAELQAGVARLAGETSNEVGGVMAGSSRNHARTDGLEETVHGVVDKVEANWSRDAVDLRRNEVADVARRVEAMIEHQKQTDTALQQLALKVDMALRGVPATRLDVGASDLPNVQANMQASASRFSINPNVNMIEEMGIQKQAQERMQSKLELLALTVDQLVEVCTVYKPTLAKPITQRGDVAARDLSVDIERQTFDRLAKFEGQVDQLVVNTGETAVASQRLTNLEDKVEQLMTNSDKELGVLEQTAVGFTTALRNAAEVTEAIRREKAAREEAIAELQAEVARLVGTGSEEADGVMAGNGRVHVRADGLEATVQDLADKIDAERSRAAAADRELAQAIARVRDSLSSEVGMRRNEVGDVARRVEAIVEHQKQNDAALRQLASTVDMAMRILPANGCDVPVCDLTSAQDLVVEHASGTVLNSGSATDTARTLSSTTHGTASIGASGVFSTTT